jgi:hypothetical protein
MTRETSTASPAVLTPTTFAVLVTRAPPELRKVGQWIAAYGLEAQLGVECLLLGRAVDRRSTPRS